MTIANFQVPESAQANPGIFRNVLNSILEALAASRSGVGASLPVVIAPEGRLFYRTSNSKLYVVSGGAWVQVT